MSKRAPGALFLALLVITLALPGAALARGKKGDDKLEALDRKVDKASGEAATAAKAIQDLEAEVAALKQEVAELSTGGQTIKEMRQRLEAIVARLAALDTQIVKFKQDAQDAELNAGFKDGFFLRAPSNLFLLRLGGFFQGSYDGHFFSEELVHAGGTMGESVSTFQLRRARLELQGHVISKIMKYRLAFEFGIEDPGPVLEAYGDLKIFKPLQIRFGRQKIPFSRQFLVHSAYQHFTERSEVVRAFAPGWDLGLVLHGEVDWIGPVTYQFGIFNGAGAVATVDDNTDFLYSARLVYEPLGKIPMSEGDSLRSWAISVGGSFAYNLSPTDLHLRRGETDTKKALALRDSDADGNIDNVGIFLIGAELTARISFLLWHSELIYRLEDPGAVGPGRDFWGVTTQLGTVPQFGNYEFALRYGYRTPSYFGLTRALPRPRKIHEAAAVVNLFTWKRRLKWQVEYRFQYMQELYTQQGLTETEVLDALMEHQVRLQAQLYF